MKPEMMLSERKGRLQRRSDDPTPSPPNLQDWEATWGSRFHPRTGRASDKGQSPPRPPLHPP